MSSTVNSLLYAAALIGSAFACSAGRAWAQPQDSAIHIGFASYGYAGERKDVKDDVVKYCEGKQSCTFKVANETLSSKPPADPSPGNDKGLIISWSCAAAAPAKAQFAEGRNATIDCR